VTAPADKHVEKASIDEAFLDLTPMVIDRLLLAHPYLATVPDDAPEGIDSTLPPAPHIDWTKAGNVVPVGGEPSADGSIGLDGSDGAEIPLSQDAEGEESRRSQDSWEDWALCLGAEIMAEVRTEVWKRLHYTCSAVSPTPATAMPMRRGE
jgi:DNA polymerase eta